MNDPTNKTAPTTTTKKLQIKKDTLRQLGSGVVAANALITTLCTTTGTTTQSAASGSPCC